MGLWEDHGFLMISSIGALVFIVMLTALPVCGQNEPPATSSAEAKAFTAIVELMKKTRQGGDKPTEKDLAAHREAGMEMAKRGKEFLQEYPSSNKAEDARALTSIGLYEAMLAGDSSAEKELQDLSSRTINDPKLPEMLKLHAFAINHIAQWAKKNGKGSLNQGSAEFQRARLPRSLLRGRRCAFRQGFNLQDDIAPGEVWRGVDRSREKINCRARTQTFWGFGADEGGGGKNIVR